MRTRLLLILVFASAAAAMAVVLVHSATGSTTRPIGFDYAHSSFTPSSVKQFADFDLYSLGPEFEGLPLSAIDRREQGAAAAAARRSVNFVSFLYGSCAASDDQGCPYPLEVQIWPACVRSLADLTLTPDGRPLPAESLRLRGVPAAFFEEGLRLELYTGTVTIVLFGLDRSQITRAAAALSGVNLASPRGSPLPEPRAGAMEGKLRC
jgi:hypothetical protein